MVKLMFLSILILFCLRDPPIRVRIEVRQIPIYRPAGPAANACRVHCVSLLPVARSVSLLRFKFRFDALFENSASS